MTEGGWIVMLLSVGAATILFVGCIVKVLTTKDETQHMTGIDMVDTGDSEEPEQ